MHVTFVATRKNLNPSDRELYEMDFLLKILGLKRAFVDLGLLTVAACTPAHIQTRWVDEYAEDIDYDLPTDLVALSAKTSCVDRAYAVAKGFREKGRTVVLGGIHASLRPDEALQHVDCVVTGEAEALWPTVLSDFEAGRLKDRYDAKDFPPMDSVPVPAWPKGPGERFLFQQVQTTRGCPFQCRFCSVPDISGQAFRFKPVENVIRELHALPSGGSPLVARRPLYVVDDNFISRTKYTRELLEALVPLNKEGLVPPWSAETTLNVAQDEALLDLFRDAGCATLILGIESISEDTLKAMDKGINFCLTYQEALDRIHARGLTVVGNFIVGFDTDTRRVFHDTLAFIQETGILYPFFSILTPMPGTGLFDDMEKAGRLDHQNWHDYDTRHVVFEPKNMRRDELMDGYIWLYEQAYASDKMFERLKRHWQQDRGLGRRTAERAFVSARLLPEMARGSKQFRDLTRRGIRLMNQRGLHGDGGTLLTMLDSAHFSEFMHRFKTEQWAENTRMFEEVAGPKAPQDVLPSHMQWDNKKARQRTERMRNQSATARA